jgi:hypothetical protein
MHCLKDGDHVVSVDGYAGDAIGHGSISDSIHCHGAFVRGGERILIVLADEDNWQLPYGCQIQRFMERPLA